MIRGRQSGLVLDVEGSGEDAGTHVILWEETGLPNQLWYYDRIDGCIRSKQTGMCLDFDDENTVVINEYCGEHKQLFEYDEDSGCIKNSKDPNKVVDVAGNETDPGSRVCIWEPTGEENQLFDLEYQPPHFFTIVSKMNGKVIDVKAGEESAGAKLITYRPTGQDNQMFYQDRNGLIRHKRNDFLFESARRSGKSIQLHPEDGSKSQNWTVHGEHIANINDPNDVVEILDGEDGNDVKVVWDNANGSDQQKWTLEYV